MQRTTRVMTMIAVLVLAITIPTGAQEAAPEAEVASSDAVPVLVADAEFFGIDLALDAEGHRHLAASQVFQDDRDTKNVYEGLRRDLWYGTDRDGSWVMQRLLEGDVEAGLGWTDPSIAVDADGSVHIAVVHDHVGSTPGHTEGIFYLSDKDRVPGDFGEPVRLARPGMNEPSLAVVDGTRYLAYSKLGRLGEPPPPAPVFVKTDRSGEWMTHRIADFGHSPVLRVDPIGRAHIIYQGATRDGQQVFLRYVRVDPETGEPTKPRRIPATGDVWYGIDLALDPHGRPHVTWETEKDILWAVAHFRRLEPSRGPGGASLRLAVTRGRRARSTPCPFQRARRWRCRSRHHPRSTRCRDMAAVGHRRCRRVDASGQRGHRPGRDDRMGSHRQGQGSLGLRADPECGYGGDGGTRSARRPVRPHPVRRVHALHRAGCQRSLQLRRPCGSSIALPRRGMCDRRHCSASPRSVP